MFLKMYYESLIQAEPDLVKIGGVLHKRAVAATGQVYYL
jgi:hypothetical protein